MLSSEKGKGNMEKIEESRLDIPYHQYQHFLSNSPWSWTNVIHRVGLDVNEVMQGKKRHIEQQTLSSGSGTSNIYRSYTGFIVR